MTLRLRWALTLLLAVAATGCDDDGGSDAGVDAGDMDAGAEDAGEPGCDAGSDPFSCEDQTPDPTCAGSWIVGLTGTVQDDSGAPVFDAAVQACLRISPDDRLVCLFPDRTDAAGRFAIVIPEDLRCLNRAVTRVLAPGQPYGTTYCPVEFPTDPATIYEVPDPYVLYGVTPAAALPPRGDEAMERTVMLPDGLAITVAPRALAMSGDYDALGGGRVDASATECWAEGETFDGAYVFSPEAGVTGGADISIPNSDGLSPGTEVEMFIVGGLETFLLDGTMIEEAELASIGVGMVSSDGSTIDSSMEGRVPYLSWLAWKAR